ncbi:MAG: acetyl-CoA carboxylase, carboxyltransferase subunit beta [Holosporales bacterium]|nr:acetyl-CoA carboxylase, carboxyltransferase subunit beta [Holosporales bacterium]
MSWLTELVRPKIQAFMQKSSDLPDDLWLKCLSCEQMIFRRDLLDNMQVCPHCNYHSRLSIIDRLNMLFDNKQYQILPSPKVVDDPLKFKDSKRYTDRLKEQRNKTKQNDAAIVAVGEIQNKEIVVFAMNFDFMGGSMGLFVGRAFYQAAEFAVQKKTALVAVTSSGGARMQEGMLSLLQMPTTVIATNLLHDACLPYIVLLTDPTMGGVSASFAMLGDVAIAESGALIGFAGPRVIEETIKQTLPSGFQRAEFLKDHGMVDIVVSRSELKSTLGKIICILLQE